MGGRCSISEHDRAKVVEIAHAILDGSLGIIAGARQLNDLRAALGIHHLDEDFVGFVAIDSETDTLPIGEARGLRNAEALIQKDREVEEAERLYRDGVLEDCRKLVARFGGPSNSAADAGLRPARLTVGVRRERR